MLKSKILIYIIFLPLVFIYCNQKYCGQCNEVLKDQYIIYKNKNYHHGCYDRYIQIYCDQCNLKIEGSYNTSKGKKYHKTCFREYIQKRCDECGDPINGIYNIKDGNEYHESCYTEYILPRCDICKKPVEDKYIKDYWDNFYHEYHAKKMPSCDNCNRLICESLTGGGYSVNSNRFICNICKPYVVVNYNQIQPNLKDVLIILHSVGIKDLPNDIPITLVDSRNELIRLSGNKFGNIQGYTNYEASTLGDKIISEDYHIYILSNLERIIFNAVLAHELLHVYLFKNGISDLNSDVREGFCNLGSNLVYDHYRTNLAKYRIFSMNQNQDPDYGLGFIKLKSLLDELGWEKLLKDLPKIR